MEIYFPVTCEILTPGHVLALERLSREGYVTVGLLTDSALKGYKRCVVSYEDRKFLLDTVAAAIGNITIVPQKTLDPTRNIKTYGCNALASGDGFEDVELKAIDKLGLTKLSFKSGHTLHSSDIIKAKLLSKQ